MSDIDTSEGVEIRYGKEIDYTKFKRKIASDVQARLEAIREEAHRYRPKTTVSLEHCPLCRSFDLVPEVVVHSYPYARCRECALVFLQERLSGPDLIDFWDDAVSGSTYADVEVADYRRENVARPKADFVLEHWEGEAGRWLDLGCGNGDLISVAREHGWEVLGLEISQELVDFGSRHYGVPTRTSTLQEYQASDGAERWEVVTAIGYYDAVDDLAEEFSLVSDVMEPGGLLFTLSPQHECLSMGLAKRYPDRPYRFICPPGSTNFFCRDTYEHIAERFGFRIRAYWYFGMDAYDMMNHLVGLERLDPESREYEELRDSLAAFQLGVDRMQMSDYVHVLFQKD